MIIYFDENMPQRFAEGFQLLQEPLIVKFQYSKKVFVKSIKSEFGQGVRDEIWIPQAGKNEACIITQDYKINRIRHQRELCEQHGLGMFYFRPPSKNGFSYWEMVSLVTKNWPAILNLAISEPKPYSFQVTSRKGLDKMK